MGMLERIKNARSASRNIIEEVAVADSPITQFVFGNDVVRVSQIDGSPWWVAKDVCDILGLSNLSESLRNLEDDERGSLVLNTLGGPQSHVTINEPGLYSLIFRSRKPEAKAFKRWVTHEVLPTIRKTGGVYIAPESVAAQKILDDPIEEMEKILSIAKNERDKRLVAVEERDLAIEQRRHIDSKRSATAMARTRWANEELKRVRELLDESAIARSRAVAEWVGATVKSVMNGSAEQNAYRAAWHLFHIDCGTETVSKTGPNKSSLPNIMMNATLEQNKTINDVARSWFEAKSGIRFAKQMKIRINAEITRMKNEQ